MSHDIDALDENIISMLQVDGRRSAADIGRTLNIPRATIRRRIDSLVSHGFITIRAYANTQKLGLPIHVWIEMQVALEHLTRVARALTEFKELRWIGIVSGRCNILAEGYFTSSRHLHAFNTERLAALNGIQQIETMHVLCLEKFTFDWTSMRHAVEEFDLDVSWPVRDQVGGPNVD